MAVNESFDDLCWFDRLETFKTKYQNRWSLIIVANIDRCMWKGSICVCIELYLQPFHFHPSVLYDSLLRKYSCICILRSFCPHLSLYLLLNWQRSCCNTTPRFHIYDTYPDCCKIFGRENIYFKDWNGFVQFIYPHPLSSHNPRVTDH